MTEPVDEGVKVLIDRLAAAGYPVPKAPKPKRKFFLQKKQNKTVREIIEDVGKETLGGALTVLSIYSLRKLVELLLKSDVLWDVFPIRYCADTVDFAVFVRYLWQVFRTINE